MSSQIRSRIASSLAPGLVVGLVAAVVALGIASTERPMAAAESIAPAPRARASPEREVETVLRPEDRERRRAAARPVDPPISPGVSAGSSSAGTLYTFDLLVLDADDQPLSGAAVYLAPCPQALDHAGFTDMRGRLHVQWRAVCESMRIAYAAAHPRFGSSNVRLAELTRRPFTAALELRPSPKVETAGGRLDAAPPVAQAWWNAERRRARLDEQGLLRFSAELDEVPGEALPLPRGWSFPGAEGPTATSLAGGLPEVRVDGVVRDPDGSPVAGARVRASAPELDFELSTRSHADGGFTLGPLPRDGAHVSFGGGDLGRYETELGAGVEPFQFLRPSLQRGRELRARWLDAAGRPLAGWRVELFDSGAKSPWAHVTFTDEGGNFTVANVPSTMLGLDLVAPESPAGLPFETVRGVWLGGYEAFDAHHVRYERTRLVFRVVDAFGRLVEDAGALIAPVDGDRAALVEYDCTTHAYHADGLPPGRYLVRINASGERYIQFELELAAGSELDLGVIGFEPRVPLVVELPCDTAVPGGLAAEECRLETADTDPPLVLGVFRARGRWRVDLPPGAYVLHVGEGDAARVARFGLEAGHTRVVRVGR